MNNHERKLIESDNKRRLDAALSRLKEANANYRRYQARLLVEDPDQIYLPHFLRKQAG